MERLLQCNPEIIFNPECTCYGFKIILVKMFRLKSSQSRKLRRYSTIDTSPCYLFRLCFKERRDSLNVIKNFETF
ncbi:CLUMA_CG012424, isoform A [Clunio marinus]|uniref:CLUMA_CG012424, isoform A n=1 Tax=Clunio marinus TaxID=568069 RepID=A0A1J1IEK3_9DIPT|nr:CLUMA_CG012424, isoform A [Clunio marinus]